MHNPYLTIWTKPKETFAFFFNERTSKSIYGPPFIIYGISLGLTIGGDVYTIYNANPSLEVKLITYLFVSILGIGLSYLILGLIQPWFIKVIGKIWDGVASTTQLANVNSLAAIPHCLVLFYQLVLLMLGQKPSVESVNAGFDYVLWIFSFRILIIGISSAQKFSYGISLLNFLLSILPFVILKLALNN